MREKLHRILDLVLDLNEQGATHAAAHIQGHVESVSVHAWEGESKIENWIYDGQAYYAGELKNEAKVNDIIRELEELRDNI